MTEIDWEALADSILDENTILFLGQGASINYENPQREQEEFDKILDDLKEDVNLHQKDGLFILKNSRKRRSIVRKLKEFYKEDFSNPVLEKIAEIPFHLIINLTPDVSIKQVFENKDFTFEHDFYELDTQKESPIPRKEKPLLYNLFGCIESKNRQNIFVEHQDLFNYLKSLYTANSSISATLKSYFTKEKTDNIIFLGCDFEKWYFQLILHLLQIQDIESNISLNPQNKKNDWHSVYQEGFKINFIAHDLKEFVDNLHEVFEEEELRKAKKTTYSPEELKIKIKTFFEENKWAELFEIMEKSTLNYEKATFNKFKREFINGEGTTINFKDRLKIFIQSFK